jgi:hypothetical protein
MEIVYARYRALDLHANHAMSIDELGKLCPTLSEPQRTGN